MIARTKREKALCAEAYARGLEQGRNLEKVFYNNGFTAGKKEANIEAEKRGFETRLRLAESYAVVFEAIGRSANMFFDGGVNALR